MCVISDPTGERKVSMKKASKSSPRRGLQRVGRLPPPGSPCLGPRLAPRLGPRLGRLGHQNYQNRQKSLPPTLAVPSRHLDRRPRGVLLYSSWRGRC